MSVSRSPESVEVKNVVANVVERVTKMREHLEKFAVGFILWVLLEFGFGFRKILLPLACYAGRTPDIDQALLLRRGMVPNVCKRSALRTETFKNPAGSCWLWVVWSLAVLQVDITESSATVHHLGPRALPKKCILDPQY